MTIAAVGMQIKSFRNEAGLSQEELAIRSGIDRAQLSKIESGLIAGVTYATISRIYDSLGLSLVPMKDIDAPLDIHPFVKWAGGKTQLLETITAHLPESFNNYYEPFVGGGALLFKLQPERFFINDMNEELICVYKCLEDDDKFEALKKRLEEHEKSHSETYYYEVRAMDQEPGFKNMSDVERAARMIYLNKAGFNGLYRVNSKGYFNVPSGKRATVTCYDRKTFDGLRAFFKKNRHIITNCDFEEAVKSAKAGDFVYFDPPYDTWDDKDSFTSYDKDGFGKEAQARLARVFRELSEKGVYVMLSNHNTKYINELYDGFHITVVPAKRMINSKAEGRGNVEEVLITNYE